MTKWQSCFKGRSVGEKKKTFLHLSLQQATTIEFWSSLFFCEFQLNSQVGFPVSLKCATSPTMCGSLLCISIHQVYNIINFACTNLANIQDCMNKIANLGDHLIWYNIHFCPCTKLQAQLVL